MNYDACVSKGSLAWLPRKDAASLDALHLHDIPLIGTFEQRDNRILFACLTGATSVTNIWGYLCLDEDQAADLDAFDCETTEELEDFVHGMFLNRKAVLAIARNGRIEQWATEQVDDDGILEATIRFMDACLLATKNATEKQKHAATRKRRQAEQARVDATRQVLEPA